MNKIRKMLRRARRWERYVDWWENLISDIHETERYQDEHRNEPWEKSDHIRYLLKYLFFDLFAPERWLRENRFTLAHKAWRVEVKTRTTARAYRHVQAMGRQGRIRHVPNRFVLFESDGSMRYERPEDFKNE